MYKEVIAPGSIRLLECQIKLAQASASVLIDPDCKAFKEAVNMLKDLIISSNNSNIEAMKLLAEIKIRKWATADLNKECLKLPSAEKGLEKAFTYLNHCLKFDYRNPELWSLLGQLYMTRSRLCSSEEQEFNSEKATLCFSKSTKYETLMPLECRRLLRLIPKYIN